MARSGSCSTTGQLNRISAKMEGWLGGARHLEPRWLDMVRLLHLSFSLQRTLKTPENGWLQVTPFGMAEPGANC